MPSTLRQKTLESFRYTYYFTKNLYQSLAKKKYQYQLSNTAEGIRIILKDLRIIFEHEVNDSDYINLVSRSLLRVNVLTRLLTTSGAEAIKDLLEKLYQQLLDLLPSHINVQLCLFGSDSQAFGFVLICRASRCLEFVFDFLRSAWVAAIDWWNIRTPFKSYLGRQLTLPSGQVQ